MIYEKYKVAKSKEEFYSEWAKDKLDPLSEEDKDKIYNKYLVKCLVFQRDGFKCKNKDCKYPNSKLTLHHTRFQKNNGKDSLKNCVTICKTCHAGFHRGKNTLTYDGMTYRVDVVSNKINWKKIKAESKKLRKENKKYCGIKISWELVRELMKFLRIDYKNLCDEDDD